MPVRKINPRMEIKKARLGISHMDDCCYYCNEFIPAGTECVILSLFAPDVSWYGRSVNIHAHKECHIRLGGGYPPVPGLNPIRRRNVWQALALAAVPAAIAAAPRLIEFTERHPKLFRPLPWNWGRRNPALATEVKKIIKGEGITHPCLYCHEAVLPGKECISVRTIERGYRGDAYIHLDCWERAGRYPPLYKPPRQKNPMDDKMYEELTKLTARHFFKPFAVQYLTNFIIRDMPPDTVPIKLPDGKTIDFQADEAGEIWTTKPYWRTWREYDTDVDAMRGAEELLRATLSFCTGKFPFDPVRIASYINGQYVILAQWNTAAEAKRRLGM